MNQIQLRQHIRKTAHIDEHQAVSQLIHRNPLSQEARDGILNSARQLVIDCRANKASGGTLDAFLLNKHYIVPGKGNSKFAFLPRILSRARVLKLTGDTFKKHTAS